jgi:DNA-binding XRE family transcriptional regulator
MRPTANQLRAARAWLGLSREQAAHAAGLHPITLRKAEHGDPSLTPASLETLTATYGARGLVFIGTSGLERRSPA